MTTLLETAESGDLVHLTERLALACGNFQSGRSQLSDDERLLQEALWYARHDDLDEAKFRLRLRSRPKWHSEEECKAAYKKAMKEKRA